MRYTKYTPLKVGDWIRWKPFDRPDDETYLGRIVEIHPTSPSQFHRRATVKFWSDERRYPWYDTVYFDSYRVEMVDDLEELAMISLRFMEAES